MEKDIELTNEQVEEQNNATVQPQEEAPAVEETPVEETSPVEEAPAENAVEMKEEAPEAAEQSAVVENAPEEEETPKFTTYETTTEIIERLKQLTEGDEDISRQETDALKSNFYRLHKQQAEQAYQQYIEQGGDPEAWQPQPSEDEALFKEQMEIVRQKRAAQHEADERQKEENYTRKLAIIDKIKEILTNPDEVNRYYNDFKALQQEWNDIKSVPAEKATDLWKTYQVNVEQFYDTLKLNNELRAYDFKKNLELKTALCERAEKLVEVEDVVSAFRQLQQLHQEFREIGPVERDLRQQIWDRFKAASTVINKRHQDYFEARKQIEQENLQKKTALCEQVEAIDLDGLKTFADWNAQSEHIVTLQQEWKTIGFAPQKMNVKIFERFRQACDQFFQRKAEYFRTVRDSLNQNLQLKEELVKQAEELKDSTDWKATTEAIVALQRRWKEIGTVPKKMSDDVWKRFNAACDHFFEARKAAGADIHSEQMENLQKKQAIVDSLAAIDPATIEEDYRPRLREAQEQWNAVGHVPYKHKEKIYKAFRAQMDRLYGALSETATRRRIEQFKAHAKEGDGQHIRERLMRQYDILSNEIKTYENNLGFLNFSSKSKSGNQLVEELNRKVEKLRADLDEIRQKIKALDATDETE
ncbi:MAG: DUF349 domain-containing protein [Bacteroidaceae bacterium]|nr:DUF349 domain-containing protein [Bacteroidaceae bacterium]